MQSMTMGPLWFMPEAEKQEAYGFDVLDRSATVAKPARAQVWFDVENVTIFDTWGKPKGTDARVMLKMRSFADPQALFAVPKMPGHERQYPRQWAAFVKGQEDVPDGTAIDELPRVSRMTRETLRAIGVTTIEQAADLPEQARQRLGMEGDRVREIARAWLKKESEGGMADMAGENASLKAALAEITQQQGALAAELAATKSVIAGMGGVGARQAQQRVEVESDPDYSDMPCEALAGDGDDDDGDPMDALVTPR